MNDPKKFFPAKEERLSPVCCLLLGFSDLFVGDCNLYLTSHRSSRMDLAFTLRPLYHARLWEKAAKMEWGKKKKKAEK